MSTGSSPESLAVDPAGRFLYVANVTGANEITSYSITPSSGALTAVSTVGAGTFPLNIVIDPAGQFAYVANENSNDISVYAIDATTGALAQVAGSPFAAGVNPRAVAID
jgi:6-phosphogluconolactonase (cycloisomerase 2 family)